MNIPKLIKTSIFSIAVGLAFCLPSTSSAQDAAPKPGAKPKPKVEVKEKAKVADRAKPKRKTEVNRRSIRLTIPDPSKAPPVKDRSAESRDQPKPKPNLKRTTWLGVAMAPVPGSLREHLELEEGFGIQVQSVVPDSPAQKAGLRRNDILTQLDEQILTTPEHLSILIRSKKKGDKVTLRLIRKGKDQSVDLVLGENDLPARPAFGSHHPQGRPVQPGSQHRSPIMHSKEWQEAMKRHHDYQRKMLENHQKQFQGNQKKGNSPNCPLGEAGACPLKKDCPNCPLKNTGTAKKNCPNCKLQQQGGDKNAVCPDCKAKPSDTIKEDCKECEIPGGGAKKKTGKPPAISVRPGFPLKIFGTTGIVKIDNQEGELTLTQENKAYKLTIKDKNGKQVFSGPYNTERGVASLPKEAQAQLKKMKLADLNVILPKSAPKKEGSSTRKKSDKIL